MSNKTSRQIEDGLKQLLWEAGRERFPYPDHFPASDFYPMPVTLLATREPRWLYFLDYMFGHLDEQGAIEINLDRAVAYGGVKERTLQKYLAKIACRKEGSESSIESIIKINIQNLYGFFQKYIVIRSK